MSEDLFSDVTAPTVEPIAPTPADDRAAAVRNLASRRRTAASTRPPGRATAPKKKTTAPRKAAASSPSSRKSVPESPGSKIARWVGVGASVWTVRSPINGAILVRQSATLGPVLDNLGAENEAVGRWLVRIAGMFDVGGAWGEAGVWVTQTAAAMTLASGLNPGGLGGMLIAGAGGALLDASLTDAAEREVNARMAPPDDADDATWAKWVEVKPALVAEARAAMVDQITAAAAARAGAELGDDQGDNDDQ